MKRFHLRGSTLVLAVLCLALGIILYRKSVECDRLSWRSDTLYQQAKTLEASASTAKRQADSLNARLAGLRLSPIHLMYIDRLREQGLPNPVEDLIADVTRRPKIIPHPGVLGGQMGFYDSDRIRVLSDSWVYAPYNDGHVSGEAILEYRVAPAGKISWRVVVSRMVP